MNNWIQFNLLLASELRYILKLNWKSYFLQVFTKKANPNQQKKLKSLKSNTALFKQNTI